MISFLIKPTYFKFYKCLAGNQHVAILNMHMHRCQSNAFVKHKPPEKNPLLYFSSTQISCTFPNLSYYRFSSDEKGKSNLTQESTPAVNKKSNQRARLKQAVRDYGVTIIVFHVAIALTSLGICYAAISNGVDVESMLSKVGFSEGVLQSKIAVGGSTFVVAYAVHKLFAPFRIGITLSVAPLVVRHLRKVGWIKTPPS